MRHGFVGILGGLAVLAFGGCVAAEPDRRAQFSDDFSGTYHVRHTVLIQLACGPSCAGDTIAYRVFESDVTLGQPIRSSVEGIGFDAWSVMLELSNQSTTALEYRDTGAGNCSGGPLSCWTSLAPTELPENVDAVRVGGAGNLVTNGILQYGLLHKALDSWAVTNGTLVAYDSNSFRVIEVVRK